MSKLFLSGNEAIAYAAYDAGCRIGAAYPGTPSTEILETFAKFKDTYAEWSPNEKTAFDVAYGATVGGARAFTSMKHVGLNVATDSLFTSVYAGVNAGFLVISADDPGIHSSQNEQDNRNYSRFAKIPMLEPSDAQEAYTFAYKAFKLSEEFDIPFLLRLTTRISHVKGVVERLPRDEILQKATEKNAEKYVMLPAYARGRRINLEDRLKKLREFSQKGEFNKIIWGRKDIGIITSGIAFASAKEAIPDASFLKLELYPYPEELIREFIESVEKVYIIEELDPFIETEIRNLGYKNIIGKELFPNIGELTPDIIKEALTKEKKQEIVPDFPVSPRPPVMCPGCPHTPVFEVLAELGLFVTGDIGCYTLGALPPHNAMHTCICMGASIGNGFGIEIANKIKGNKEKVVSVIGDSTFLHSGIAPLMDMVYNKSNGLVIILNNDTTAMTGGQEHPGTGYTAKGEETKKIDFVNLVKALGVERVFVQNPYKKDEMKNLIQRELNEEGVSVIITNKPCVLKKL